jgi:hypothetical protein
VKAQVLDPQESAGSRKRCAHAFRVVRKDELRAPGLRHDHGPRLRRVFEAPVVAFLLRRMFRIPDHASAAARIVIAPFQATDLRFPTRGVQRDSKTDSIGICDRLSLRAK